MIAPAGDGKMQPLYRQLNLTAREAAEIMATVTELLARKLADDEVIRELIKLYEGEKLCFAVLTLGRLLGMVLAVNEPERAKSIVLDFTRFMKILESDGRERLVKVIEQEILEEVASEVEKLKDAF
jgi:hypothetical protein